MSDDNEHECPHCGQTYYGRKPLNGHDCDALIAVDELEALADDWEQEREAMLEASIQWMECDKRLKQLRALIE